MKKNRRVIVIGIDGADFRIIDPLLKQGKMPNLEALIKNGARGNLKSTFPPHSAPAWVSFMTGKNPGNHGIYGFRTYDLSKYTYFDENLCNSSMFKGQTFFDVLSKEDTNMLVFGVPLTYPPWPINGQMVAGYPTPDPRRPFTYPEAFAKEIGDLTRVTIDQQARANVDDQLDSYDFELNRLSAIAEDLFSKNSAELKVFVTGVSDAIQHRYWKFRAGLPTASPEEIRQHEGLIDHFYGRFDDLIGQISSTASDDDTLIVMSDHGSSPRPRRYFNTSYWLRSLGLLDVKQGIGTGLKKSFGQWAEWAKENLPMKDWVKKKLSTQAKETISGLRFSSSLIDWQKTTAYRVPMQFPVEGININLQNRQAEGRVSPGREYDEIRNRIIDEAKKLVDPETGARLIEEAHLKEDLYYGPHSKNAPDIVITVNSEYDPGFGMDQLISPVPDSFFNKISGYHALDGILVLSGTSIRDGAILEGSEIIDIAPTVLYAMGFPVPKEMDGKALTDAFSPDFVRANPVSISDKHTGSGEAAKKLSEKEEDGIKKALKGLGYLD